MSDLSEFVGGVAKPILIAARFRGTSTLRFQLDGDHGDSSVVVTFRGRGGAGMQFSIVYGVIPPALLAYHRETRPGRRLSAYDGAFTQTVLADPPFDVFSRSGERTRPIPNAVWCRGRNDHSAFASAVARKLSTELVPLWNSLLDPRALETLPRRRPDIVRHAHISLVCHWYPIWSVLVRLDDGDPTELLKKLRQSSDLRPTEVAEWAERWLLARL